MTEKLMSVHEVVKLTGITARTLHYYDEIGLLKPTEVTETGYRMYGDAALSRLQNILLFRELQFPLKEIKVILDSPDFDPSEAIAQQIRLLELQYKHIGKLIDFARKMQKKGIIKMNFLTGAKLKRMKRRLKRDGAIPTRIGNTARKMPSEMKTTIANLPANY